MVCYFVDPHQDTLRNVKVDSLTHRWTAICLGCRCIERGVARGVERTAVMCIVA